MAKVGSGWVSPSESVELEQLRAFQDDYRMLLLLLAVLSERYLELATAGSIIVDDAALGDAPDLDVNRDEQLGRTSIAVSR